MSSRKRNVSGVSTPAKRAIKRARGGITKIPRSLGPFSKKSVRTLHYTELVSVSVASGFGSYVVSCNGMYDPNITGVGHQPMGFDQLMALFNHYQVIRSSCSFTTVTNFQANDTLVEVLLVAPEASTSHVSADIATACERQGAVSLVSSAGENMRRPVRKTWRATEYFDTKNVGLSLRGTASANPTEQSYYQYFVFDQNLGTYGLTVKVDIWFTAEFWEPVAFASS